MQPWSMYASSAVAHICFLCEDLNFLVSIDKIWTVVQTMWIELIVTTCSLSGELFLELVLLNVES